MNKTIEIQSGWLSNARQVISPNYNPRPEGASVRLIVLHNISLPPAFTAQDFEPSALGISSHSRYVEDFFQNQLDSTLHPYFDIIKDMKVSAHLLIARSGKVIQFV